MNTPGYRLSIDIPVRFSDTDAMGHVNNAVYLSYLEEARFVYMRQVLEVTDWRQVEMILARVEIDYRSPLQCGETARVSIRTTRVGGASFGMDYEVIEKASGRLVAEAKTVQVWYNYKSGKISRLPAAVKELLRRFDSIPA